MDNERDLTIIPSDLHVLCGSFSIAYLYLFARQYYMDYVSIQMSVCTATCVKAQDTTQSISSAAAKKQTKEQKVINGNFQPPCSIVCADFYRYIYVFFSY